MKRPFLSLILLVVIIVALYYLIKSIEKKRSEVNVSKDESKPVFLPDDPLPEIPKYNNQDGVTPIALSSDSPLVVNRMRSLFMNEQSRDAIIRKYGVKLPEIEKEEYPSGINEVLLNSKLDYIPLIPEFISSQYNKEIDSLISVRPYEELAKNNGVENADTTYNNALNFSSIGVSLFPYIKSSVFNNSFGKVKAYGNHDRYRYWDMDKAIKSFKNLFSKAKSGSKDLENALMQQAIEDLIESGYKVVGYG